MTHFKHNGARRSVDVALGETLMRRALSIGVAGMIRALVADVNEERNRQGEGE